jgi:histidinol phosphatase-like PHP family hydrolase
MTEKRVMALIKEYGKIVEVVDLLHPPEPYEILSRLREKNIKVLHVTGAHDVKGSRRIYHLVIEFVTQLIKSYKLENAYKANRNEELES